MKKLMNGECKLKHGTSESADCYYSVVVNLNFLYSSAPTREASILRQSPGFGMIIAMYPSLSACNEDPGKR